MSPMLVSLHMPLSNIFCNTHSEVIVMEVTCKPNNKPLVLLRVKIHVQKPADIYVPDSIVNYRNMFNTQQLEIL